MTSRSTTVQDALRIAHSARVRNGSAPASPGTPNIAEDVTGGLHSAVLGRTDHLPISVPSGAYILPADIVSALGEGNTQAGMAKLDAMFKTHSMPTGGGGAPGKTVDIAAAGGEYIVSPQAVARIGKGNMAQGHATLDAFVKRIRGRTITHLKKLPGPVRGKP